MIDETEHVLRQIIKETDVRTKVSKEMRTSLDDLIATGTSQWQLHWS